LILDDYSAIDEPAIHRSLAFLVDHLPGKAHLILTTRSEPPLPLARWRARDQLIEVRTRHLRCTPEETALFLDQVMHLDLPAEIVQEMYLRTEGWLVGLQLLGLALKNQPDPANMLSDLSGSHRFIMDYLIEKVLRQQTEPVQSFLLRTSILKSFTASLCEAVTGQPDSQSMLDDLERGNLFLFPLDKRHSWYRYHALFAQALSYQLEQTEADQVMSLHERAAEWYFEEGHFLDAVHHALKAQNWDLAAAGIQSIARDPPFRIDEMPFLLRMLEVIPISYFLSRPSLSLQRARFYFLDGQYKICEQWLEIVQKALTDTPVEKNSERASQLGGIYARQAVLSAFEGDSQRAQELARQASQLLLEQDHFNLATRALALSHIALADGNLDRAYQYALKASDLYLANGNTDFAIIQKSNAAYFLILKGELHRASQVLAEAIQLGSDPGRPVYSAVGLAFVYQAELQREWNQLDHALERCLQGLTLAERGGYRLYLEDAYLVLSRIHTASGKWEAAEAALRRAGQLSEMTGNQALWAFLASKDRVGLWLAQGDLDQARAWADGLEDDSLPKSMLARQRASLARIRTWLTAGKLEQVEGKLLPLLEVARNTGQSRLLIEVLQSQALLYSAQHRQDEMLATVAEVVNLAGEEGFVRIFLDEGDPMRRILSRLKPKSAQPHPYLDSLLEAFQYQPRHSHTRPVARNQLAQDQMLIRRLTPREMDVLRCMAQGASNQQIAEQLVITIDTVKRHITNIFTKLGVSNRTQAVLQARDQDLVTVWGVSQKSGSG
jgi:LuxR family maltose regulon positive regulatory protein